MATYGYTRSLRLLSSREFQHVFDNACFKVHGKGLLALACANDLDHVRAGMVFGKKSMRRAVDRNRLKRLTRESIRLRQHWLPAVDIVVISKRGVADLDSETLQRQLDGMWRRIEQDVKRKSRKVSSA